eukprot:gene15751-21324_t
MNLDDLLNDIDISKLPENNKNKQNQISKATTSLTNTANNKTNSQNNKDLDSILDEAADSTLVEKDIRIPVLSSDVRPWLASSANVPKDFRDKWNKMVKIDSDVEVLTTFAPSHAYQSLDVIKSKENKNITNKKSTSKALMELIKRAGNKIKLDDSKINKILLIVNPVTDSEHGQQLQQSFAKQLMKDFSYDIKNDCNYDATLFPNIASNM